MQAKRKFSGRAVSIPTGLAISAAAMLGLTVLGSCILAYAMEQSRIQEENIGWWIMGMLFLIPVLGSGMAAGKIKHRKAAVCLASGGIYLAILFSITALFFGGQYEAVWETTVPVIGGCCLGTLLFAKPKRQPGRRRMGHV